MGGLIYGLLGRKLGHSFSVPIHKELGCADYGLIELEPDELGPFIKSADIGGLNVTIPYKKDVVRYLDDISPLARLIGSVNTIVRRNGRLTGFNTDACGFRFMARQLGVGFAGAKVVVFGSGGASLTVQEVSKELGAAEVVVISRDGPNNYSNLSKHLDARILVNATPLGTYPNNGGYPADPGLFSSCEAVLDLVYNPMRTAFLQLAERAGIPCCDGLSMLTAQAKAAEELFTGRPIDDGEVGRITKAIRRSTQNIVLVGMPGSGKSTVGAKLAQLAGRPAADIDALIEEAEGRSIRDIFAHDGEAYFREKERELIARCGKESGSVIITGGGAVKDMRNYASLHQNGRIYRILRDISALSREDRPLSQAADLEEMYRARKPMYEAFSDSFADNNGLPDETAAAIWRDFCENPCN